MRIAEDYSDLMPHERLLHAAIQRDSPPDAIDSLLSDPDLDWPQFVAQSVRHGVAQTAARRLSHFAGDPRVPADVSAALDRIYRANGRRNEVMFAATGRLLQALNDAGIRCLVLKGVALASTVYDDPALRNFADIDILVDDENMVCAGRVAEARGFVLHGPEAHAKKLEVAYVAMAGEDILTDTMACDFDPDVTREKLAPHCRSIKLEIHRNLDRLPNGFVRDVDTAPFWYNAVAVPLPEAIPQTECREGAALPHAAISPAVSMLTPSPEVMLVHLCQHAAYHRFNRLLFALDVERLLAKHGATLDWDLVASLERHAGETGNVRRLVDFVERYLTGQKVAPSPRTLRGDRTELTLTGFFRPADSSEVKWSRLRQSGLKQFVKMSAEMVFPPVAHMRELHGDGSAARMGALYLSRPFYLLGRAVRGMRSGTRKPIGGAGAH